MAVPPSASELFAALRILVLIDEERGLYDRGAKEGGYRWRKRSRACAPPSPNDGAGERLIGRL